MLCRSCKADKPDDDFGLKPSGKPKKLCKTCCRNISQTVRRRKRERPEQLHDGRTYYSRAVGLREIGFSSYADYLASPLWREIRARVYAAKGRDCHLCGKPADALHHNRYHRNDLLGKNLRYINPVCNPCHTAIEFKGKRKATVKEAASSFRKRLSKAR